MASAQVTGTTAQRPRAHGGASTHGRARDWAEIQERMLVPLYQAVYERLEVGSATSLLGLGCRSGLSLLLAAERGAEVAGLEPDTELRELAQGRHLRVSGPGHHDRPSGPFPRTAQSLVTLFELWQAPFLRQSGASRPSGEPGRPTPAQSVARAAGLTLPGGHVVLAGWGPPERCESAAVLDVARRRAARTPGCDPFALSTPGALETLLTGAGLRPAGSGRVNCPFAYPDLESAVRGMLSTGLYEAAIEDSGAALVEKELEEALHPFVQRDASVRMANLFRYVIAEKLR
ncbi:SAM-dependent methyltransferase [Kitasatospora sp. GP82]|uniref:SAM-dependent methyltransferase n=1 Tax=Kitasatospora sp. GP82 TaxID=3035089 RepID=UPI0024760202|nr:SAM-dependent methyltransferase [Kitasatospora sp. GP82]MDH6129190.1 SAM-dependent methyltransferase [Kitasatospora sp. GP82]